MDKNFKPVYVQGTNTGKGVIEALEQFGGINKGNCIGDDIRMLYFIDPKSHIIDCVVIDSSYGNYIEATAEEVKPLRWRAEEGGTYYIINWVLGVKRLNDDREPSDDKLYNCGNYFKTKEEAQEMAEKIKKVLLPD